jgi:hypothetical protein
MVPYLAHNIEARPPQWLVETEYLAFYEVHRFTLAAAPRRQQWRNRCRSI